LQDFENSGLQAAKLLFSVKINGRLSLIGDF